jgi:hypothetical protein
LLSSAMRIAPMRRAPARNWTAVRANTPLSDHMEKHQLTPFLLQSVTAISFFASSSPSELLRFVSHFSFTTYLVGFSFLFLQTGVAFG